MLRAGDSGEWPVEAVHRQPLSWPSQGPITHGDAGDRAWTLRKDDDMNRTAMLLALTATTAMIAGAASAQNLDRRTGFNTAATGTAFGGTSRVDELNEDIREDIEDDADRNLGRRGNFGRELGFDGSLALRGSASSGNDDAGNLGIGAKFGYFDGANGYDLGFYYAYARARNDDGEFETDQDSLLYDLQYTRDFAQQFYGFAKLQGSYNGDDDGDEVERRNDVFLGFGVGYRVIDTPTTQWSVQGGPGYRFTDFSDIGDAIGSGFDDDDVNEAALGLSSAYANRINQTVYLTMDTDIITSDSDTVLYNDLGLNVAMSNQLALRTSLQTEYHTDPAPGDDSTDHRLGVSLVYSFN